MGESEVTSPTTTSLSSLSTARPW